MMVVEVLMTMKMKGEIPCQHCPDLHIPPGYVCLENININMMVIIVLLMKVMMMMVTLPLSSVCEQHCADPHISQGCISFVIVVVNMMVRVVLMMMIGSIPSQQCLWTALPRPAHFSRVHQPCDSKHDGDTTVDDHDGYSALAVFFKALLRPSHFSWMGSLLGSL